MKRMYSHVCELIRAQQKQKRTKSHESNINRITKKHIHRESTFKVRIKKR